MQAAVSEAGSLVAGSLVAGRDRTTTVLVVDDHALVAEGTCQVLETWADIEVVGRAGTASEALDMIDRLHPDVAVVDINLPGESGLHLARKLAQRGSPMAVLIVTAYDDYAYVAEALDIGVGGYLLKTATSRELVEAVRAVAAGILVLDRAVSRGAGRAAGLQEEPDDAHALTARETAVLRLLARGLPNKSIAAELGLSVRTVEGHVSAVLSKLGVASRTEATLFALENHLAYIPRDPRAGSC
ncbi:MAG TPA: response regulator transcription factor [Acidimicrobiales bacterium]|nr:response regulator transcription factor [Acidimicrobiales bacterium]